MTDGKENKPSNNKFIGIFIGVVAIAVLILVFGAKPCSVNIFGISLKLPFCDEHPPSTTTPIAGIWTVKAGEGNSDLDVIITIVSGCEVGNVCGTINLPSIPCQASIYVREIRGNRYDYDAIDHQGACGPVGVEYLELRGDGSLEYSINGFTRFLRRK